MNSAVTKILEVEQSQISYEYYEKFVQSQIMSDSKGEERDKKEGQIKKGNKHIFVKDITYILDGKYCGNLIILRDITKIKDSEIQLKELKYSLDMIEDILDYAYEGIVLVDGNGKIVKMNYEKLLGIKEEDALGKKVQDVIENTRMHIVAKTGKKEIHYVQKIQGHDMITNRIPIIRDGKVIGAVGTVLFKDAAEVKDLAKDLAVLEKRITGYK
jgi:PAS domain S-box-containing protein